MTTPAHNSADSVGPRPEEERLGELINEFFDRRQQGEDLSEEAFLAEHAEDADQLREHLSGLDLIGRLGSSTRQQKTLAGGPALRAAGSSAADPLGSPDQPLPDLPGYKILKQVGRGGMGIVFKAIQLSTKRVVALKLLLEGALASDSSRKRFEREIALAAQLRHPHIIPIYDSGVAQGRMFYAMEFIYGQAVGDHLANHPLSMTAKLRIFIDIGEALGHAHQRGVIHRDVKPTNILIDGDGVPHILDFGLAKAGSLGDATTSVTAQIIGTPAYMSPEQAVGDPTGIDTRTDIYSLGIVLYEMLTGRLPYETSGSMGKVLQNIANDEPVHPAKHNPAIGGELSAIVLKALEKAKGDRYQSVDAFCGDIRRYLAGEPISARPATGLYLVRKALWKYRLPASLAAVLLIFGASNFWVGRYLAPVERSAEPGPAIVGPRQPTAGAPDLGGQPPDLPPAHDPEAARRQLAWWRDNLDPAEAKLVLPFLERLSEGVAQGEDPTTVALRILAESATGTTTQTDEKRLTKELSLDPMDAFAPYPAGPEGAQPTEMPSGAKVAEALETLKRALAVLGEASPPALPNGPSRATSQPTTRPAAPSASPSPPSRSSGEAAPPP